MACVLRFLARADILFHTGWTPANLNTSTRRSRHTFGATELASRQSWSIADAPLVVHHVVVWAAYLLHCLGRHPLVSTATAGVRRSFVFVVPATGVIVHTLGASTVFHASNEGMQVSFVGAYVAWVLSASLAIGFGTVYGGVLAIVGELMSKTQGMQRLQAVLHRYSASTVEEPDQVEVDAAEVQRGHGLLQRGLANSSSRLQDGASDSPSDSESGTDSDSGDEAQPPTPSGGADWRVEPSAADALQHANRGREVASRVVRRSLAAFDEAELAEAADNIAEEVLAELDYYADEADMGNIASMVLSRAESRGLDTHKRFLQHTVKLVVQRAELLSSDTESDDDDDDSDGEGSDFDILDAGGSNQGYGYSHDPQLPVTWNDAHRSSVDGHAETGANGHYTSSYSEASDRRGGFDAGYGHGYDDGYGYADQGEEGIADARQGHGYDNIAPSAGYHVSGSV